MLQAAKSASKPAPGKASQPKQGAGAAARSSAGLNSNDSSSNKAAPAAGGSALASLLCRPADTSTTGRSGWATHSWQDCTKMQRQFAPITSCELCCLHAKMAQARQGEPSRNGAERIAMDTAGQLPHHSASARETFPLAPPAAGQQAEPFRFDTPSPDDAVMLARSKPSGVRASTPSSSRSEGHTSYALVLPSEALSGQHAVSTDCSETTV